MNEIISQGGDVTSAVVDGNELTIRVSLAGLAGQLAATPTIRLVPLNASGAASVGFELRPLKRLRDEGRLPVTKVGRTTFFDPSALVALAKPMAPKTVASSTAPEDGYMRAVDAARSARAKRRAPGSNQRTTGR